MFPGNSGPIPCLPAQLGRAPPPPLPGGYALGETVVYVAEDYTFASGNRLAHGAAGEVMGPTAVNHVIGKGLSVLFPGNKATVPCELADISRAAPQPSRSVVTVPPGKLGTSVIPGPYGYGHQIKSANADSPLFGHVQEGDTIAMVDDTNTELYNHMKLVELLTARAGSTRRLTILTSRGRN